MARARREAEQLAELLDSGVVAGESPGELADLLTLADSVRTHVSLPAPSPDFRAALRTELLHAPPVTAPATPIGAGDRFRRFVEERAPELSNSGRAVAATGLGAIALAASGVVTASQQALPGDFLYGLKGGTEDVRMAFASGDAERGRLHLRFADERLSEVEDGLDRLTNDLLGDTLRRLEDHVLAAADDLLAAFADTADVALVRDLTDFTGDAAGRLGALTDALPAEVVPLAENSIEVLRRIDVQAAIATGERAVAEACAQCGQQPTTPPQQPQTIVTRPGEGPAVPVTECDCAAPVTTTEPEPSTPVSTPTEPEPEPSDEPTEEPTEEPEGVDVVPTLPGPVDPVGQIIEEQVDDLLDNLPIDPLEPVPAPVRDPAEEAAGEANEAASETSETVDEILP